MADPTLTNHFMGSNSGIADGSWPASEAFNSTMDFTLQLVPPNETDPGFAQTQCSGSWAGKSYPMSWVSCEASWAKWRFQKSASWNECNFVLEVEVSEVTPNAWSKTSLVLLSATVTANTPSVPNSYLSCIDCGPPYSGVCGKTDGYLSVPASIPLTVGKTSKESFLPFSIPALSTYSPSGRPGQPCQPAINFTAIDPNARNATSVCTKTWQCNDTNPHLFDHVVCEDPAFWFNLTPPDGEVGSFGVANFVLRVHHELPYGRNSTNGTLVTILGESPIKVGDQLAGECGASGVCFWALNGSALALPINSV